MFGQRQTRYAKWLLSCDRIALDCYRACYLGLGQAKSIPAPPPFCYMATGFAPATFRRGIPLKKLGKQFNPFPLVQLPAHRLTNPWTLGAVLHETGHNLQTDLGLSRDVRGHAGSAAGRPDDRGIARGHFGSGAGDGFALQPTGPASDAAFPHADQHRTAAADGICGGCEGLQAPVAQNLSEAGAGRHSAQSIALISQGVPGSGGRDVLPALPRSGEQESLPGAGLWKEGAADD